VPDCAAVFDKERLGRFVTNSKALGYGIGQPPIFDHQNNDCLQLWGLCHKIHELAVHFSADRTLRAMLENENGIGFGSFENIV
jgi:hypothetical protein